MNGFLTISQPKQRPISFLHLQDDHEIVASAGPEFLTLEPQAITVQPQQECNRQFLHISVSDVTSNKSHAPKKSRTVGVQTAEDPGPDRVKIKKILSEYHSSVNARVVEHISGIDPVIVEEEVPLPPHGTKMLIEKYEELARNNKEVHIEQRIGIVDDKGESVTIEQVLLAGELKLKGFRSMLLASSK